MAWSTTVLAWGLLENAAAVSACGEQVNYLETIKWATDYFVKAHISPDELVVQVGNGGTDHGYWGPAETITMDRPVYTINPSKPGTEVAMETAAALAAASILFKGQGMTDYSTVLLDHARQLFIFGDTYRGVYSDSVPDAANYYKSWSGYNDEIVWAAAWLYRATNDETYLNRAKSDYTSFQIGNNIVGQSFDWDNKAPGVAALLAKLTSAAPFTDDAQKFLNWWRPAGGVTYTPGGLAWIRQWGPNRYAANAAFLATVVGGSENTEWAKGQIAYMLGNNPLQRSYVCGYGNNYPVNPHHRGAHGSTTNDINNPVTNLHVLYGALVGGPDQNDAYADDRLDYVKNEVATDYNGGFTSALASLAAYTQATVQARGAKAEQLERVHIYDDEVAEHVEDLSWAQHNVQDNTRTYANSKYSISFKSDSWAGVFLKFGNGLHLENTKHTGVEMYLAGNTQSLQKTRAYFVTVENGNTVQVGEPVSVVVGLDWTKVFISLDNIAKSVVGVVVQDATGTEQATVYIDNVAVLLK
jgi:endoglucanase